MPEGKQIHQGQIIKENEALINQINTRPQFGDVSDWERQSERSKYSFTQAAKNQQYSKDDANFDFSEGGPDN